MLDYHFRDCITLIIRLHTHSYYQRKRKHSFESSVEGASRVEHTRLAKHVEVSWIFRNDRVELLPERCWVDASLLVQLVEQHLRDRSSELCLVKVVRTVGEGSGQQEAVHTRRYTCAPWRPRGACGACGCAGGARVRAPRRARARAAGYAPRSTAMRPPCPYLRAHAKILEYGVEECSSLLRLFSYSQRADVLQSTSLYMYTLWSSSSSTNCWLSSSMCCSSLHVVR